MSILMSTLLSSPPVCLDSHNLKYNSIFPGFSVGELTLKPGNIEFLRGISTLSPVQTQMVHH